MNSMLPEPQPTTDFAADRLIYPVSAQSSEAEKHTFVPTPPSRQTFYSSYLSGSDEMTCAHGLSLWLGKHLEPFTPSAFDASAEEYSLQGWEPDALLAIANLQTLPDGWDSYDGVAVEPLHAQAAWTFLAEAMRLGVQLPEFIPLGDGGVQLEWSVGDRQLTYTSSNEGPAELWLSDPDDDRRLGLSDALSFLVAFRR
jgi:hypothetical protein